MPVALCALIAVGIAATRSHAATLWRVTTTADASDGACTPTLCTLRDAVAAAQDGDSVYVPGAGSNYTLTLGDLTLAHNVVIYGDGARSTVIDGANASRVFTMTASGDVTLSGLRITGGNGRSAINNNIGGGIYQQYGTLTLLNVSLDHNSTSGTGGGLDTNGAALVITGSTISGNSATNFAGGIDTQYGPAPAITNSTIADNTTGSFAGGIALPFTGTVVLLNDTIADNTATSGAAGIDHGGATADIINTLVAGNTTGGVEADCASIPTGDPGYNLSGDASCSFTASGDQQHVTSPQLGPLQDNGGGTDTIALLNGSPAIDAGWSVACPTVDQRGDARPDSDEPAGSACDIGAYESGPQAPTVITGAASSVDANTESVSGSVNPNGDNTTWYVEYATDAYYTANHTYDQTTTAASVGSGSVAVPVSTQLSGLTAGTTYDFQLVATNGSGTSLGANGTFTTTGAPTTSTSSTSSSSSSSASSASSTATATSSASAGSTSSAGSTTAAAPVAQSPDLALSVSHLDPFGAGGNGVYHVQILNRGGGPTTGTIRVSAQLPAGIAYTSAGSGWSCSATAGGATVACSFGGAALAAGQAASLDLSVAVAASSHGGTATFGLSDPGDGDAADKAAGDPTTVGLNGAVGTSLSGAGAVYAGATTTLTLGLENRTQTVLAAGTSVDFTVPTGGATGLLAASATGGGWTCSLISVYAEDMIHCADSGPIGSAASANALSLSVRAPMVSAKSSATISYEVRSAAGGVLAGPITQPITILPVTRARLALALTGPMTLAKAPQNYLLAVSDPGSGATTGPTSVSLAIPSGVNSTVAPSGTGWVCTTRTGGYSCQYAGHLSGGGAAAPLALSLAGNPGAASPVSLSATASSVDGVGAISASAGLAVDQPPAGVPNPVVSFTALTATHVSPTGGAQYAVTISNTGDGKSGTAPLTLSETLPAGVTAQGAGPGWSCHQQATTLSCAYAATASAGTVLTTGGKTPPLTVTLSGTGSFAGGSVPISSHVGLSSTAGHTYTSSAAGHVSVPNLQSPLVAPVVQVDSPISSPGGTVHATLGIINSGLAPTSGPVAVALLLPAGLQVAPGSLASATPDDRLPPAGTVNAAPVPVTAGSGPGMTCSGGATTVYCIANSLAPSSQSTISIPVQIAATSALGTQTLQGGIVQVSTNNIDQESRDVASALATQGASALGSLTPVHVTVNAFTADAGADQTLPAAIEHPDGTISPTPVNLDASKTLDVGKPLSYGWVQTAGPPVTFSPSPAGATPGSGGSSLPAFPPRSFVGYSPGTAGPGGIYSPGHEVTTPPQAYGAKASFTYPNPRSLSGPTTFGFEVYVTDGAIVRTASTSVTLDPPPPAPPVAPTLCLWDTTRTSTRGPGTCLKDSSPPPNAGDEIVVGAAPPYLHDAAGDTLHYAWAVAQPAHATFASLGGQPCLAADLACLRWPAHVSVVALRATITNGQHDATGAPEQAVASVSVGHSPPPLTVTVAGPATPAAAGSTVGLTASVRDLPAGATATYQWTQTGGPTVSGLHAQGATVSFTAPAPTSTAQTVTFQAAATSGASSGTGTVTVALAPAPALAVNVTPASGGPAPAGGLSVAAGATLALHAAGTGGAGGPYTFTWSVTSGGGTVTPASTTDSADASYAAAERVQRPGRAQGDRQGRGRRERRRHDPDRGRQRGLVQPDELDEHEHEHQHQRERELQLQHEPRPRAGRRPRRARRAVRSPRSSPSSPAGAPRSRSGPSPWTSASPPEPRRAAATGPPARRSPSVAPISPSGRSHSPACR